MEPLSVNLINKSETKVYHIVWYLGKEKEHYLAKFKFTGLLETIDVVTAKFEQDLM